MPKKVICLIIILILVTSATGCGLFKRERPQEEVPESEEINEQALAHFRKTVFYFVNEHDLLVPVTRDIPSTLFLPTQFLGYRKGCFGKPRRQ